MSTKRKSYASPAEYNHHRKQRRRIQIDLTLWVLAIILVIVLVGVVVLNRVKVTSKVEEIMNGLQNMDPTTNSFTLGKNRGDNKFTNVTFRSDGKLVETVGDYPVDQHGNSIILKDHGTVLNTDAVLLNDITDHTVNTLETTTMVNSKTKTVPETTIVTEPHTPIEQKSNGNATNEPSSVSLSPSKSHTTKRSIESTKTPGTETTLSSVFTDVTVNPNNSLLGKIASFALPTGLIPAVQGVFSLNQTKTASSNSNKSQVEATPTHEPKTKQQDKNQKIIKFDGVLVNSSVDSQLEPIVQIMEKKKKVTFTLPTSPSLSKKKELVSIDKLVKAKETIAAVDLPDHVNISQNLDLEPHFSRQRLPIIPPTNKEIHGLTISGFNESQTIPCPDGYHGSTCANFELCDESEIGYKPLMRSQFDYLGLRDNNISILTIPDTTSASTKVRKNDNEHPLIRIKCMGFHKYSLESCEPHSTLDDNLNCIPNDPCTNQFDGFKHTMSLSAQDSVLPRNQYYMCLNHKSVLHTCDPNTIYKNRSCVPADDCFGKGKITLRLDNHSYIQCENDTRTVKRCKEGVEFIDNNYTCKSIKHCNPGNVIIQNDIFKYTQDEWYCNDAGQLQFVNCSKETTTWSRTFEWDTRFKYTIENWPKEIIKDRQCVTADDSIIYKPVQLKFSEAMSDFHLYDLAKDQYVCDDNENTHRWDYQNNALVPYGEGLWDTSTPCQTAPVKPDEVPFYNDKFEYPQNKPFIFLSTPTYLPTYQDICFWPIYSAEQKSYMQSELNITDGGIMVYTYISELTNVPVGFLPVAANETVTKNLQLRGVNPETKCPIYPTHEHYFIATGKIRKVLMYNKKVYKLVVDAPIRHNFSFDNVTETEDTMFGIDWRTINKTIQILPELFFTVEGFEYRHVLYEKGFAVAQLKYVPGSNKSKATFSMGNIIIDHEFDVKDLNLKSWK